MKELQYKPFSMITVLIIISAMPNNLLYNSTVMSENFQLLALVAYTYALVRFSKNIDLLSITLLFSSQWLCAIAHTGLGVLTIFHACILILIKSIKKKKSISWILLIGIIILNSTIMLRFDFLTTYIFDKHYDSLRLKKSHLPANISGIDKIAYIPYSYTYNTRSRSQYKLIQYPQSPYLQGLIKLTSYPLGPFIFELSSKADYLYYALSWLRIILFFKLFMNRDDQLVPFITLLIFLYCLFSLSTNNYGTALRHHITTDWILIMLSFYKPHMNHSQ